MEPINPYPEIWALEGAGAHLKYGPDGPMLMGFKCFVKIGIWKKHASNNGHEGKWNWMSRLQIERVYSVDPFDCNCNAGRETLNAKIGLTS